jgi:hypothetical protein
VKPLDLLFLRTANPNGFHIDGNKGGTFHTSTKHLQTLQVDAAGFAEINLDTSKVALTCKLHKALRANSKHCTVQCASSSFKAQHNYKPGGTISIVRDDLTVRVQSKGADPLGQWSYTNFTTKEHASSH